MIAVRDGKPQCVKLLIRKGARINLSRNRVRFPLVFFFFIESVWTLNRLLFFYFSSSTIRVAAPRPCILPRGAA
jgi:hypothetical protein